MAIFVGMYLDSTTVTIDDGDSKLVVGVDVGGNVEIVAGDTHGRTIVKMKPSEFSEWFQAIHRAFERSNELRK